MDDGRRPLEDHERLYAEALGAELRRLRLACGMSQSQLARAVEVGVQTIRRLEQGRRRTRRSTLERYAREFVVEAMIADESIDLEEVEPGEEDEATAEMVERLVAIAGPALAPESPWAERSARRRYRRANKLRRKDQWTRDEAYKLALPMAKRMDAIRQATGSWPPPPRPWDGG